MYKKVIKNYLLRVVKKFKENFPGDQIEVGSPQNDFFGDYTTNLALKYFKELGFKNPLEFAQLLVKELEKNKGFKKVVSSLEILPPGFINFKLTEKALLEGLKTINRKGKSFGRSNFLKKKRFLIEHTSPNIIKALHLGHLRNNVLGMFLKRLFLFLGAEVKTDCLNNDRGIHIMKAVWAYLKYGKGTTPSFKKIKPDHFVQKFYEMGVRKDQNPKVKEEQQELLRRWEKKDKEILKVWKKLTSWVYQGLKITYQKIGSCHDKNWYESQFYEKGRALVLKGLKKGVFRKLPDGAILSNLKEYQLPDTILLRSDGTTLYHTQDLYLIKLKRKYFPKARYFWVIGPEQSLYLKQLFSMAEQLKIGQRKDYYHLPYGYLFLKGRGKMSSREGTVVLIDDLLKAAFEKTRKIMKKIKIAKISSLKEKEKVAEKIALGAIKYTLLKYSRMSDIYFDLNETITFEGNSGPYLQYTYSRCVNLISKKNLSFKNKIYYFPNKEEINLLKHLIKFPEVLEDVFRLLAPNLLCDYLYNLCQKFNFFYEKHRILGVKEEIFRLQIVKATSLILEKGLELLGIDPLPKM